VGQRRTLEADYVKLFLGAMAGGDFALFVRQVGAIKVEDRVFRSGIAGQADIWGVHLPTGKHVEIEVKRYTQLSAAQVQWRYWCCERNVPWTMLKVEQGESVEETVQRWVDQLKGWQI
jgi:hypothetical protein